MPEYRLRSAQFRREREASWRELESLLAIVDRGGLGGLSHDEIARLATLYRNVVSSLSVARAISLDRNLLEYLTRLASRAYVVVYSGRRRAAEAVAEFLARDFPAAVRQYAWYLAASLACVLAGVLCGYLLTLGNLDRYYDFVPAQLTAGRTPEATTEHLRAALYRTEPASAALSRFAAALFSNNSLVGMVAFVLGFVAGIPTVWLIFTNALGLGAMAALYQTRRLQPEFCAWVLPHGITEFLAVCLCGAAGLAVGMALLFPGASSRLDHLAVRGRRVAPLVLGAVLLFFLAGLIEGLFRQLVQDVTVRWLVALATLAGWAFYFGAVGRGGRRAV